MGAPPRGRPPGREREALLEWLGDHHAGHLDAARELPGGRTWLGPEESQVPRD